MKLRIERRWKKPGYTIGILFVDGVRLCETLEDTDRHLCQGMSLDKIKSVKVYGQTAIPTGIYGVELATSPKFSGRSWARTWGGLLPLVKCVPGFDGVRIHPGNTAADTLGCVLVGENKRKGAVLNSVATYNKLMKKITAAINAGEKVTLEII